MALLKAPTGKLPIMRWYGGYQVDPEQFLHASPCSNEVLKSNIHGIRWICGSRCRHSANLPPEPIKGRHHVFERIPDQMLGNVALLRASEPQQLLRDLKVLAEDGEGVVRAAVRAECKRAINRINQSATVAHHISLKLPFAVGVVKSLRA